MTRPRGRAARSRGRPGGTPAQDPQARSPAEEPGRLTTNRQEEGVPGPPPARPGSRRPMNATHLVPPPASHRWFMSGLTRATRAVMKHPGQRPRIVAALAVAAAVLLAGCGSSGGNFSAQSFAPSTAMVSFPNGQPGHGKPAVTMGSKNFTEALILGQLYAQALQAKGFTVRLVQNIGPTEVIDPGLLNG